MLALGFPGRNYFGEFLNQAGLKGIGVEVGTHRGEFARTLLDSWDGSRLYCVDPWIRGYDPADPASGGNRAEDYNECSKSLYKHKRRASILIKTSEESLKNFTDNSLDFVYIDGNHQPEYVTHDVNEWWKKVKPGGILAGHDFLCPGEVDGSWGRFIQPVVISFAGEKKVDVCLVPEPDNSPWSWYFVKP